MAAPSALTLVVLAGVHLAEMPVVLWRREVLHRVEVELGFKIIWEGKKKTMKQPDKRKKVRSDGSGSPVLDLEELEEWPFLMGGGGGGGPAGVREEEEEEELGGGGLPPRPWGSEVPELWTR